ncbi:hypothetical protein M8C21_008272, partial [Ambrosia artemisiifolia]
ENIFTNEGNGIPQAWNSIFGIGIQGNEGNGIPSLEWESNCVINSIDQRDIFESSLTSIMSSPANSGTGIPNSGSRENIILKELIGRKAVKGVKKRKEVAKGKGNGKETQSSSILFAKDDKFLSMKLATVNPRMDASTEALISKDMFRPQVAVPNNIDPFDTSVQSFPYAFHSQINSMILDRPENQFSMNPLVAAMHRNSTVKPSHIDGFGEASTLWENDLQSVVKMALGGQDQPQGFHGQMKVEL